MERMKNPSRKLIRAVALSRKIIAGEVDLEFAGPELAEIVYGFYKMVCEKRIMIFDRKQKTLKELSGKYVDNDDALQLEVE